MRHLVSCSAFLFAVSLLGCGSSNASPDDGAPPAGSDTPEGSTGSTDPGTSTTGGGATTAGGSTGTGGSVSMNGGSSNLGGAPGAGGSSGTGGSKVVDAGPGLPAPPSAWANATGNLANMASDCGNVSLVAADPTSSKVIAGVALKGLWATEDGGKTWSSLGTGAGSAKITNRMSAIVFDPEHPGVFWESGTWNGGGIYKTTDSGTTFTQLGSIAHNDSVAVDLSDPERKTLLAGPHEAAQKLYLSSNAGATWTDIGSSIPGGTGFCNSTKVLSATTLLVGCEGGGVFRSTNKGSSWTQVGNSPVLPQPLTAANGTIYWPSKSGGAQKSTDQGLQFSASASGPTVGAPSSMAELPDGRIVVMGKDHLQASADGGQTWKPIGEALPAPGGGGWAGWSGVTYSAQTKTFFIWHWDCGNQVLPDAIRSSGFDYTTQ